MNRYGAFAVGTYMLPLPDPDLAPPNNYYQPAGLLAVQPSAIDSVGDAVAKLRGLGMSGVDALRLLALCGWDEDKATTVAREAIAAGTDPLTLAKELCP